MCVDIGYKSMLGPDGLPKYIKGIKINRSAVLEDYNKPHISAHTNPSCLVILNDGKSPYIDYLNWGFLLNAKKNITTKYNKLYNARAERILENQSIWNQVINNRCLVVADGVYEHQRRKEYKLKVPHYITFTSGEPILLPALFNTTTKTFALVTRAGNSFFNQIHNDGPNKNRMPLFLKQEDAEKWISHELTEQEIIKIIDYEIPDSSLTAYTVFSIRAMVPRPDGKEKNEFYSWETTPDMDTQLSLF